jgi:tRNA A-37 threonylcarbamoyl transferase component Bud32/tetratricopeptide (TPR) repeat protein
MELDDDLRETTAGPTRRQAAPTAVPTSFAGGRYHVERLLGRGGQKDVYLARDTFLKRNVAIALLKNELGDLVNLQRLRTEAQAMARLGDNPHIVTVYDIGEEEGQPYIVSQYIESGSVADLLKRTENGRLSLEQVLRIGAQVSRALAYSHERGVVHADVKPNNVWLTHEGTAKLGDFGLAFGLELPRLTHEGTVAGTVAYMAPELATEARRGPAADLYALGVMLYEMTTGRLPFQGDHQVGIIWQHINARPVAPTWHNPQVPQALEALILRLMSKAPEDRPHAADEVAMALEAIVSNASPLVDTAVEQDSRSLARLAGGVFVGREYEMSTLRSGLNEARSGHGQLFLLAGEPGAGKTRLGEQLATYARLGGAQVLVGKCYEGDGAPAFWPWVQIIRSWIQELAPDALMSAMGSGASDVGQIVPEVLQKLPGLPLPPALEPEQARFRLFDSITTFLKNVSHAQPVVIILDDLHWADKPSLLLLQFVARELRDTHLLVLGTYRNTGLQAGDRLSQSLGELAREGLSERIVLRGLPEEEVARFIRMTTGVEPPSGLASTIYQQTDGNPFFVSEIVRLLVVEGRMQRSDEPASTAIEVPDAVRDVIARRIDHLPEDCGRILTVASVIGREFNLRVLGPLCSLSDDALLEVLEQAVTSGLIIEKPYAADSFVFSHALIRETLYDTLSTPRRVRLHRRIGEVLESFYQNNVEPHLAELAYHFFQASPAGDVHKAVDYAVRAAERALRLLAYEEVVEHYERAYQASGLTEPIDERRRCDLLLKLGESQMMAGYSAAARETFRQAASSARVRKDWEQLPRAALGLGGAAAMGTSYGRVDQLQIDLLNEALSHLDADDSPLRIRLLAQLSLALYHEGEPRLRISQEAVTMARRLRDKAALLPALYSRCVCLDGFAKGDERLALATEIVEVAEEVGNKEMGLRARYRRYREFIELGDLRAADEDLKVYSRLADELRQPLYQWLTPFAGSVRAVMEGRFEEGERLVQEAAAIGTRVQERNTPLFLNALTSAVRKLQGRYGELAVRNRELVDAYPRIASWRASLAQIYVKLNRQEEARTELERLTFDDYAGVARDWSSMANLVDVCAALHDVGRARTLYDVLEPFDGRNLVLGSSGIFYGPFAHYLGLLEATMSRWEMAARHFDDALEMNRKLGARPFECQTQYEYGAMLLARSPGSDREKGLRLLERSLATAEELGMRRVSDDARALLSRV